MRNTHRSSGIFLVILIALIAVSGSVMLFFQLRSDRVSDLLVSRDILGVLIVVSDGNRVVSSQIFFYSKATHKGALLDVPSNTGRILESEGRIGSIARIFDSKKIGPYMQTIGEIVGVVPDFYIHLQLSDVIRLVDLVEGIELFIPNPVELISDDFVVLLPSGNLVLDGNKTVEYLGYRDDGDNYTDIAGRNQKIFQGLFKAAGKMSSRLLHPRVRPYVHDVVHTDVSAKGLYAFIEELGSLDSDRMVLLKLRGTSRLVDSEELLFPHSNGNLIRETLRQTMDSLVSEDMFSDEELNIGIEIYNGTFQTGLASRTSHIFLSFGYDVKRIGNASEAYEKTLIIDRKDDLPAAQRLGKIIRCANIVSEPFDEEAEGSDTAAEITIIIGKDFDGRYCRE